MAWRLPAGNIPHLDVEIPWDRRAVFEPVDKGLDRLWKRGRFPGRKLPACRIDFPHAGFLSDWL
jgi:hypothetical protein